jgi:hypothetical protein
MKLLLIKFFILLFITLYLPSGGVLGKELKALYKVEFGSLNIGSLKWEIYIDSNNYKTTIFLKDRGMFSGLYDFTGKYLSEGIFLNNEFISYKYNQFWKTKKKTREIEIIFNNKMVSNLIIKPKEKETPRIDYLNIGRLADPLSSFLNILLQNKNNFKTIDGRRLYKMSIDVKKKTEGMISKKIIITDYINIWADHKRNDLKFISTIQDPLTEDSLFPINIKIKNKGLIFKLTKI